METESTLVVAGGQEEQGMGEGLKIGMEFLGYSDDGTLLWIYHWIVHLKIEVCELYLNTAVIKRNSLKKD